MPTGCHAACLEAAENLQGFQCIYSELFLGGRLWWKNGGEFSVASHATEF